MNANYSVIKTEDALRRGVEDLFIEIYEQAPEKREISHRGTARRTRNQKVP